MPVGGLIAASMLRSLEQQVQMGDTTAALQVATRYLQMGHPPRALAGVIGHVAAVRDVSAAGEPKQFHPLVLAAAAIDEYMMLPPALAAGEPNALLTAAIRLAGELDTGHRLADKVLKVQSELDRDLSGNGTGLT